MKVLILSILFVLPLTSHANPELFKALMAIQERANEMDHEKTMETLERVENTLETINEMLPEVQNNDDNVAEIDLSPDECLDIPLEDLVCYEGDYLFDDQNVCPVDVEENYSSVSR